MSDRRSALTPDALTMMDTIARAGSFAAAARELGKVPSALTYSVRQLEDALDVLLFDRRSGQAVLTAAGEELLREGIVSEGGHGVDHRPLDVDEPFEPPGREIDRADVRDDPRVVECAVQLAGRVVAIRP